MQGFEVLTSRLEKTDRDMIHGPARVIEYGQEETRSSIRRKVERFNSAEIREWEQTIPKNAQFWTASKAEWVPTPIFPATTFTRTVHLHFRAVFRDEDSEQHLVGVAHEAQGLAMYHEAV